MDFGGPQGADFENVRSLNRAYLSLLAADRQTISTHTNMSGAHLQRLQTLSARQMDRLATTPFLLFSLREREDVYWERLLDATVDRDLFEISSVATDDYRRLVAAALGFIWQLVRQNPYTARLICGASLHWCELIAEQTLYCLLAHAGSRSDVLIPRAAGDCELWSKLLMPGVAREKNVRQAAQLSALQAMLTRPEKTPDSNWAVAACKRPLPRLRVAEDPTDQ